MKHLIGRAYRRHVRYEAILIAVVCRENPRIVYFELGDTGVALDWDFKTSQDGVDSFLKDYTEELKAGSLTSAQLLSIIEHAHNAIGDNPPVKKAAEEAAQTIERIILGDV